MRPLKFALLCFSNGGLVINCKVCLGKPNGRCSFCGQKGAKRPKKKRKMDLTPIELAREEALKENLAYLKETWQKLRKFKMETSGVPSIDRQVIQLYGDWREEVVV
jgi:hypothetical protein